MTVKYKYLSECVDRNRLIDEFKDKFLRYFEEEIRDYVKSDAKNCGDYYPDIIM